VADKRRVLIAELTAREGCEAEVSLVLTDYAVHVRAESGNEAFEGGSSLTFLKNIEQR